MPITPEELEDWKTLRRRLRMTIVQARALRAECTAEMQACATHGGPGQSAQKVEEADRLEKAAEKLWDEIEHFSKTLTGRRIDFPSRRSDGAGRALTERSALTASACEMARRYGTIPQQGCVRGERGP